MMYIPPGPPTNYTFQDYTATNAPTTAAPAATAAA